MRLLHVCGGYSNQKLYLELMRQIDIGVKQQLVYVPVRTAAQIDGNRDDALTHTRYQYSHILCRYHRVLFRSKIRAILTDIVQRCEPGLYDVVHAHSLYSDGAVALGLYRQFGVPYVVAVRNTDVNVFMRLRPDLRWLCRDIIAHASAIVFITPAYMPLLASYMNGQISEVFESKVQLIPNGLSAFWLDERLARGPAVMSTAALRLLYVGDFTKNKNIPTVLRAVASLSKIRSVTLTLVGAGGNGETQVRAMLASGDFPETRWLGRIDDPEELRRIYRAHDILVMPSIRETFGMVYLEALSQGLSVVYTKGQGIDGYFPSGTVGEAVDPLDVDGVRDAIVVLAERRLQTAEGPAEDLQRFAWSSIVRQYFDLYRAAMKCGGTQ